MAITLSPQALEDKITALFVAAGSSAPEARQVASNLVLANLSGHDSHGIGMAPRAHRPDDVLGVGDVDVVVDDTELDVIDVVE